MAVSAPRPMSGRSFRSFVPSISKQHVRTVPQHDRSQPSGALAGAFAAKTLVDDDRRLLAIPSDETPLKRRRIGIVRQVHTRTGTERHFAGGQAVSERQKAHESQARRRTNGDGEVAGGGLSARVGRLTGDGGRSDAEPAGLSRAGRVHRRHSPARLRRLQADLDLCPVERLDVNVLRAGHEEGGRRRRWRWGRRRGAATREQHRQQTNTRSERAASAHRLTDGR